jgi:outer membrane protein assembly factor BamB
MKRRRRLRLRPRAALTVLAVVAAAVIGLRLGAHALRAADAPGAPSGAAVSRPGDPALPSEHGLPAAQYTAANPPPAWSGPLPYPVLIADEGNGRMLEVSPTKRILWQYPASGQANSPLGVSGDDTFFSPHGNSITTNDEDGGTILRIGYYTHTVLWHFGVAGQLGGGSTHLNYPDDAYLLPNGNTIVADIRNCRELTISPAEAIIAQWGAPQTGYCQTNLARGLFGYPNGDTPQPNGDILMSFISGDVIALLSPTGAVLWQTVAPDLYGGYVSDAQLLPDGNVLVAGYGKPGTLVIFNPHTGQVVWRYYVTSGPGELNHPSLALMLPNGNVLLNDDRNDRVIVIDPRTNRIVWQFGVTGVAGTAPGYLNIPDGVDVDYYRNWKGWLAAGGAAATPGPAVPALAP